ncbi:MAG: cupin domain-containing protein [Betaproteobacteria bacterium]|nr:cupin domain-containing protein [Betaproteobacteria bacterium]
MQTLLALLLLGSLIAGAQDSPNRHEKKRADLSGAPGMEVISSIVEYKPGDKAPAHFHHGVEMVYVIEGGMVQYPGKEPQRLETGATSQNLREAMHGGYTIVGDKNIRIFTVHIVDKGKPLYDSREGSAATPPAVPTKPYEQN